MKCDSSSSFFLVTRSFNVFLLALLRCWLDFFIFALGFFVGLRVCLYGFFLFFIVVNQLFFFLVFLRLFFFGTNVNTFFLKIGVDLGDGSEEIFVLVDC